MGTISWCVHLNDHDTWSAGSFFLNPVLTTKEFAELQQRVADKVGLQMSQYMPFFPTIDRQIKVSAAWLMQQAGCGKGFCTQSSASLSSKHNLSITNRGDATAADIVSLARAVRDRVESTFDVRLIPEAVLIGCSV